ncbi:hypothetical protein PG999_002578 [Apiospora kogelbergensis]|uniref:Uncharacterized protein n=1 Tax=Apiospora kogelbergensis TaxID=1337665 RepID=A0AAW0R8U6_9PEZI
MEPSELPTPATLDFLDANNQLSGAAPAAVAATGFGHGSFVEDGDIVIDYTVEGVSSGSTAPWEDVAAAGAGQAAAQALTSNHPWSARQAAKKQRLERKGHTKSRRGCYNCKKRRVKVMGIGPPKFADADRRVVPGDVSVLWTLYKV